jgi:hypothetical protein
MSVNIKSLGKKQRRAKRGNKGTRRSQTFKLPPGLIVRLGHYIVDCSYKDVRRVEKSEVVEESLDQFLTGKGY